MNPLHDEMNYRVALEFTEGERDSCEWGVRVCGGADVRHVTNRFVHHSTFIILTCSPSVRQVICYGAYFCVHVCQTARPVDKWEHYRIYDNPQCTYGVEH